MTRPFTGRHMAAILVGFFGTVIAVNFTMASYASSTFGGIVVENSYVASQEFNGWLESAAKADALGWQAEASRLPDGRVEIRLTGAPEATVLSADARHPLGRLPDRPMGFARTGQGRFVSAEALPPGRWTLRIEASAGTEVWRREEALR
jgi:nitrogen fixation protein FixH